MYNHPAEECEPSESHYREFSGLSEDSRPNNTTNKGYKMAVRKKKKRIKRSVKSVRSSTPWKRPLACIIYAQSGLGKSSFAAAFPKPYFFVDPNDTGILELYEEKQVKKPVGVCEVVSFKELENIEERLDEMKELGVETVVLDSLTGMEYLCFSQMCDDDYNGDWSKEGFMSFHQGPVSAAKSLWPKFLMALNTFIHNDINVVLIAHSQIKAFNNPASATYDKFTPYLNKETWQQTHRWASVVLFMNQEVETTTEGGKTKATETAITRNVYTEPSPIYDAKNRHGLEPLFETGSNGEECFKNFCNSFPSR